MKRALDQAEPFLVDDQQSAFSLLLQKFSYLRRFSPLLLNVLPLETKTPKHQKLIQAVHILKELNDGRKRKLAPDTPIDFVPKTLQDSVKNSNSIQKRAYECAILLQLRKEVKAGNITVKGSKRFCDLEMFFMPYPLWEKECEFFFRKSNLPHNPLEAELYLKERLKKSYTFFLDKINDNSFARIEEGKLVLSTDEGDCLPSHEVQALEKLKDWLSSSMRSIKLPDLLIEVDNDLQFTRAFMPSNKERQPEDVCAVLAALMAHGCFIGTYTMSRMANISYDVLRKITDWQLTEEGHRLALACLVNSISNLDITTNWGRGLTSSSDGQRFSFTRNSLSKTFSHFFSDYALEFYTFVADNYAPF